MPRAFGAALVPVLLLLSGCAADQASPKATEAAPLSPTFDDTTGAIEGSVVDDEGLPVEGAKVEILQTSFATMTVSDGRFVLSNLPPGLQDLLVDAEGYEPATRSIHVASGQLSTVLVVLERLASRDPHHVIEPRVGHWGCAVAVGLFVQQCGDVLGPPWIASHAIPLQEHYQEILNEVTWRPSSAITQPAKVGVQFFTRNQTDGKTNQFFNAEVQGTTPVRFSLALGEALGAGTSPLESGMASTFAIARPFGYVAAGDYGFGPIIDQKYEYYRTTFHAMRMPDDFTAIPDA